MTTTFVTDTNYLETYLDSSKNIVMDTTQDCRDYNLYSEGIHGEESYNKNGTDTKLVVRDTQLQQFFS